MSCNLGISRVPQRHHHNRVLVLGVEKVQGVSVRPVVVEHGAQIVSGRQVKVSQKIQWSPKIRGEDGQRHGHGHLSMSSKREVPELLISRSTFLTSGIH